MRRASRIKASVKSKGASPWPQAIGSDALELEPADKIPSLPIVDSQSHMSVPSLPPELIEDIVDHCAWNDDTHTLAACSLVSSQWLIPSRQHLFRSLLFSTAKDHSTIDAEFKFLSSSSCAIPTFVRRVVVVYFTINEIATLLPTLALMGRAQSLIVDCVSLDVRHRVLGSYAISDLILRSLVQSFGNITLLEMNCDFFDSRQFVSFISSFTSLKTLDLNESCLYRPPDIESEEECSALPNFPPPPLLKVLRVTSLDISAILHWFFMFDKPPALSELCFDRFIRCTGRDPSRAQLARLLKAVGPNLKHLKISQTEDDMGIWAPDILLEEFDLTENIALEYFHLRLISNNRSPCILLFERLCSQLTSPVLREAYLDIDTPDYHLRPDEWSELDKILATLKSPYLETVAVRSNVPPRAIRAAFPRCRERGVLRSL